MLSSGRRKASAEASAAEEDAIGVREKRYEDIFEFMQQQIADFTAELADKTRIIRELHEQILELTKESHEKEMLYMHSRCDDVECSRRKPPFKWMRESKP